MNEFSKFHPAVNFVYFAAVITFSMLLMNPVCLGISFFSATVYAVILNGRKTLKLILSYVLPLMLISAMFNVLFNHEGVTILGYFKNGNPITAESIYYGIASSFMVAAVILHFSSLNKVMTSDKLMCVFSRIIPSLSLVFSMVLRFVPEFQKEIKKISIAQENIGQGRKNNKKTSMAVHGIKILSMTITQALENGVDTADSMKSRGYGLRKRTAYSNYSFTARDICTLIIFVALSLYVAWGMIMGAFKFTYFPLLEAESVSTYTVSLFAAYLILMISPVVIETAGEIKWKQLKSKI